VDHVNHFASVDIHQHDIVIIANPAIRAVNFWQAIAPRIADPVSVGIEQRTKREADA